MSAAGHDEHGRRTTPPGTEYTTTPPEDKTSRADARQGEGREHGHHIHRSEAHRRRDGDASTAARR